MKVNVALSCSIYDQKYSQTTAVITKSQSLVTMNCEAMRNIDIEALAIDNLLGSFLALFDLLILLPGTFCNNQLMTALMDNASAY